MAVGVIAFLSLLNCRGVHEGKLVQNVMTVAKVLALGLLIVAGLTVAVTPMPFSANLEHPFEGSKPTASPARPSYCRRMLIQSWSC